VDHPITSLGGLVVFLVGAGLLAWGKITWEQFLIFVALSGVGALMKDPLKKE
jgi:hypothetical protein